MMEAATSWATGTVNEIRAMNVRQLLLQAVNLGESAFIHCLRRRSTNLGALPDCRLCRRANHNIRSHHMEEPDPVDWQRLAGAGFFLLVTVLTASWLCTDHPAHSHLVHAAHMDRTRCRSSWSSAAAWSLRTTAATSSS